MQATSNSARAHVLTVQTERLNQLRDAHGIKTDTEFARRIGVDYSTLRRVKAGESIASNEFLGKLAAAFPHASFDSLFVLIATDDPKPDETA